MHINKAGIFLTIEGIEGVGKTTAVKFIEQWLFDKKIDFVTTREPGGTVIAEQIRQVLLTPNTKEPLQPHAELLLMFAARAQHITQVLEPALKAHQWVISDRFVDASYAYQGGGRGIPIEKISMLDHWIVNGLLPHRTILLDAPPELGLMRAKNRSAQDRIEQEKIDFFERVRAAYLFRAEQEPKRFRVIDATKPLEDVQSQLIHVLSELI